MFFFSPGTVVSGVNTATGFAGLAALGALAAYIAAFLLSFVIEAVAALPPTYATRDIYFHWLT